MSDLRKLAEAARDNPGWTHVAYMEALAAFIAAASPDVVLGLLDRLDAWNEGTASACARAMVKTARDFQAERDEAREAVRRLAAALDDIGCGAATLPGYNMNDAIPTIAAVLNDPVVRRIVEGNL